MRPQQNNRSVMRTFIAANTIRSRTREQWSSTSFFWVPARTLCQLDGPVRASRVRSNLGLRSVPIRREFRHRDYWAGSRRRSDTLRNLSLARRRSQHVVLEPACSRTTRECRAHSEIRDRRSVHREPRPRPLSHSANRAPSRQAPPQRQGHPRAAP